MKKLFSTTPAAFLLLVSILLSPAFASGMSDIETAILEEDYPKAEKLCRDFIDGKPSKAESDSALYYLGLSQLRLSRYADSRKTFDLLVSGLPKSPLLDKAYLGYIDSLFLDEKYEDAIQVAKEFLFKNPQSEFLSLVYLKLARANLKLARWQEATDYLKKIINDFPHSSENYAARQLLDERQYFTVQVGAFLEAARSQKLVSEITQRGEYAYVVETLDRQGRKFYRVRVGKLASLDEAQKLQSKLTALGYPAKIYP